MPLLDMANHAYTYTNNVKFVCELPFDNYV